MASNIWDMIFGSAITANKVLASPNGSAGPLSPRSLVAADLPAGTGTVTSVAQSFTGGLISVSGSPITGSGTLALTVAGTSGGIPYFSSTSAWASSALLASTGLVIGGGAGTAPATSTQLVFSAPTLTIGLAGTSSGVLALTGSSSGQATLTAPATAGTANNPIVISNGITTGGTTVLGGTSGGVGIDGTTTSNSSLYVRNKTTLWNGGVLAWSSSSNPTASADTGISRVSAGLFAFGNGSASDATGNLNYNRISKAGADMAGQATITAGNTTQAVSFAANYTGTGQPVICLTPTSDPLALGVPVGYWVTYSGGAGAWTGFTVNIQTALAGNVVFNYIVVGVA